MRNSDFPVAFPFTGVTVTAAAAAFLAAAAFFTGAAFLAGAALRTGTAFLAGAGFFAGADFVTGAALRAGAAFFAGTAFLAGAAFFAGGLVGMCLPRWSLLGKSEAHRVKYPGNLDSKIGSLACVYARRSLAPL